MSFSVSPASICESARGTATGACDNSTPPTTATLTATLSPAQTVPVAVDIAEVTVKFTLSDSGTLAFAAGDTSKTITVTAVNNTVDATDYTPPLASSTSQNWVALGAAPTLTIEDDDYGFTAPTITVTWVGSTNSDALDITWDGQAAADGYRLEYRVVGTTSWTAVTPPGVSGGGSKTYRLDNLTVGSAYQFRLAATKMGYDYGPWSATVEASPGKDYDADSDGLVEITTLLQLNAVRYDLDGDGAVLTGDQTAYDNAFPGAANNMGCPTQGCLGYELSRDLDMDTGVKGTRTDDAYHNSGLGWEPIGGVNGTAFTADFDGNNFKIKNLFINRTAGTHAGLFAYLQGGHVQRVGVEDVSITHTRTGSGHVYAGGLAGNMSGSSLTDAQVTSAYTTGAVTVTGTMSAPSTHVFAGGLIGSVEGGTVSSSYSWADVTATASGTANGTHAFAGGLIGVVGARLSNATATRVDASYAAGDVSATAPSGTGKAANAGGLVGELYTSGTIKVSYARGSVTASGGDGATGAYEGGLVGYQRGNIDYSYATGAVSHADASTGGLVGHKNAGTTTASYYNSETDGRSDRGEGTAKTTAQLQAPTAYGTQSTDIYKDWNADLDGDSTGDNPWNFGTANQYPALNYGRIAHASQRPVVTLTLSDATIVEKIGTEGTTSTVTATLSTEWNEALTVTLPAAADGLVIGGSNATDGVLSFTSTNYTTAQTATVKLAANPGTGKTVVVDFTRLAASDPEVSPKQLTFTGGSSGTWDTTQTISVKFLAVPTADTARVDVDGNDYDVDLNAYRRPYDLSSPDVDFLAGATTGTVTLTAQNDYNDLADASLTLSLATHPAGTAWVSAGTAPSLTIKDDDSLAQVTGVTATQDVGGVKVSWTKVTGATGYTIYWKSGTQIYDSARDADAVASTDCTGTSCTLTIPNSGSGNTARFVPGTTYTFRVQATKAAVDDGLPSAEVTVAFKGWIVLSVNALSVSENQGANPGNNTGTYTVKLGTQPTHDVTVTITRGTTAPNNHATRPAISPTTLTFTSTNWDTAQTVTLTVTPDTGNTDEVATFIHTATSTDTNYGTNAKTAELVGTASDSSTPPVTADFTVDVAPPKYAAIPHKTVAFTDADGNLYTDFIVKTLPDAAHGKLALVTKRTNGPCRINPGSVHCTVGLEYIAANKEIEIAEETNRRKLLQFEPVTGFTGPTTFTFAVKNSSDTESLVHTVTLRLDGAPDAPSPFTVATDDGRATLSWTAPSDPVGDAVTKHQVRWVTKDEREAGPWTDVTDVVGTTAYTHAFTGLTNGVPYVFLVRSVNNAGAGAEAKLEKTVNPATAAPKPVEAGTGTSKIILTWDDPGDSAITGYEYQQRELPVPLDLGTVRWQAPASNVISTITEWEYRVRKTGGSWTSWADICLQSSDSTCKDKTSALITDTSLLANSNYTVQVRYKVSGTATTVKMKSGTDNVTTDSNGAVTLSWVAVSGATGYEYRTLTGSGNWSDWADAGTGTSKSVTGLTASTDYQAQVRYLKTGDEYGHADMLTASTVALPTAKRWSDAWTAVSGSDDSTVSAEITSGLTDGTTYEFRVRAKKGTGNAVRYSFPSKVASVTLATAAPAKPTGLAAVGRIQSADLTWTKHTDASIYKWEYSKDNGGTWADVTGSSASTAAYTVTGLTNNTAYTFKVRAVNYKGASTASNGASATPVALPAAPTGLDANGAGGGGSTQSIDLTWNAAPSGSKRSARHRLRVPQHRRRRLLGEHHHGGGCERIPDLAQLHRQELEPVAARQRYAHGPPRRDGNHPARAVRSGLHPVDPDLHHRQLEHGPDRRRQALLRAHGAPHQRGRLQLHIYLWNSRLKRKDIPRNLQGRRNHLPVERYLQHHQLEHVQDCQHQAHGTPRVRFPGYLRPLRARRRLRPVEPDLHLRQLQHVPDGAGEARLPAGAERDAPKPRRRNRHDHRRLERDARRRRKGRRAALPPVPELECVRPGRRLHAAHELELRGHELERLEDDHSDPRPRGDDDRDAADRQLRHQPVRRLDVHHHQLEHRPDVHRQAHEAALGPGNAELRPARRCLHPLQPLLHQQQLEHVPVGAGEARRRAHGIGCGSRQPRWRLEGHLRQQRGPPCPTA